MERFEPGTSVNASTEVELTFSARRLRNMDVFSKSDPMLVVSMFSQITQLWQEVGRTEVIMNNLNPDFATKIVMQYHFEEQQQLKFDMYDIDSQNLACLEDHDFLGTCFSSLGQIVSSGNYVLPLGGSRENKMGDLIIVAEELSSNKDELTFRLSASGLPSKWWSCLSPYLEIHKVDESNDYTLVYRSEVGPKTREPMWKKISIPVRSLCGGDYDRSIRIRCISETWTGPHKVVGETFVSLQELVTEGKRELILLSPKNPSNKKGTLLISDFQIKKCYSFLEFILGGMQIHCTVAIDFTASNGNPSYPESLHYISDAQKNQYEQALLAVVEILQDYDSDKMFPVLGFGARIPPHGHVSHEFFVNLHPDNPYCAGVEGVMKAYQRCIRKVQLFGPTNFSPVIKHVSNYARAFQDGSQYFILLIITDGVITDMLQTKQAIIAASSLPLSIIIVGVGPADFNAMSELDADVTPLCVGGVVATRDIVQFVPFRDVLRVTDPIAARIYLAKEVLAEVPDQVVGFMKMKGFVPNAKHGYDRDGSAPPPYSET